MNSIHLDKRQRVKVFSEINSSSLPAPERPGPHKKSLSAGVSEPSQSAHFCPADLDTVQGTQDSTCISGKSSKSHARKRRRAKPCHPAIDVASRSPVQLQNSEAGQNDNSQSPKESLIITDGVRRDLIQSYFNSVNVNGETWNVRLPGNSPAMTGMSYPGGSDPTQNIRLTDVPGTLYTDNVAKRVVIGQLLGDRLTNNEIALMEKTLGKFSIDNLMLLADYGVKFYVRNLNEMPENFDGFNIKEHFMKGHRELIDAAMRAFKGKFEDLKDVNPDMMTLEMKRGFLVDHILNRNQEIKIENGDFGIMTLVDSKNLKEIYNISRVSGSTFPTLTHSGAGVFYLRHRLSEGVILHEAAHALDIVKNLDSDRGALKQMREDRLIVTGSERDWALGSHYDWFQQHTKCFPGEIWSNYALEDKAYEYAAEAVRLYFQNPDKLKKADYDMYRFAEEFATQRPYPRMHFSHVRLDPSFRSHDHRRRRHLNTGTRLPDRRYNYLIPQGRMSLD